MASITIWKTELADDMLPNVCMKCGATATTTAKKSFRWYPPWINILILAGVLIWAIVASILTKRATVRAPFCDEHAGHWRVRFMIAFIPLFGALMILIAGITVSATANMDKDQESLGGFIALVGGGSFVLWLIVAAIVQSTGIRPTEITDDTITLTKVHPGFIDALRDDRDADEEEEDERDRQRRAKRKVRDRDYDD